MISVQCSGGHGSQCFCIIDDGNNGNIIVEEAESAEAAAVLFAETGDQLVNQMCQRRQGDLIRSEDVSDLIDFDNCSLSAVHGFLSALLEAYQSEESLVFDRDVTFEE